MELPEHAGPCYARRLGRRWLLTNDWGHHAVLRGSEYASFLSSAPRRGAAWWTELEAKGFLRERLDFAGLAERYRRQNAFLWSGPRLHVMVLTSRCNQACGYCQAGSGARRGAGRDMSLETAGKVVEFAFRGPAEELTLEFQGGEPLLNWEALVFAVRRGRELAAAAGRALRLAVVTNMTLLDDAKLEFLMENGVGLCTSLDGPAALHDRNRPFSGGSSHALVERWLGRIARDYPDAADRRYPRPNAILTATRASLAEPEAVVDEYARLGLDSIFARPLTPLGAARKAWAAVGYEPEAYLAFYARLLARCLELERAGRPMRERMAAMLLTKVLRNADPGFTDLRSPCGAAFGQLAYDHDGGVYTCDEGRLLAEEGDPLFRIGDVRGGSYEDAVRHPTVRACAVASNLEEQPVCAGCAYRPFCGVCPVYNYAAQDTIWGRMGTNGRCIVLKGLFDLLFKRLQDERDRPVLERWADSAAPCGPACAERG
ncbi:MAG: His-Xaa-Ser system radical SAM maturase HxsB [Elusimicrobia bacterium]|nr:His-Xaa-Ser system radical SAM maturase HxsB [Elusimicrobiota bacterium]